MSPSSCLGALLSGFLGLHLGGWGARGATDESSSVRCSIAEVRDDRVPPSMCHRHASPRHEQSDSSAPAIDMHSRLLTNLMRIPYLHSLWTITLEGQRA